MGISIAYPSKNAWVKELGIANIKLLADFLAHGKGAKNKKNYLVFLYENMLQYYILVSCMRLSDPHSFLQQTLHKVIKK
ncbi:hypothetical protein Ga0466249_003457 [Sporomusaceae bacterium BoRhaA]|nr:hypothetical protein [Pelorhabdus rhamnosifermentans]